MKKLLICIGLALALSACSSDHIMRFSFNRDQIAENKPSYQGRSHFFLWGMLQKTNYSLANVCQANGINAIETHWTLFDSLMGGLTMGIYAPESYSIYCN